MALQGRMLTEGRNNHRVFDQLCQHSGACLLASRPKEIIPVCLWQARCPLYCAPVHDCLNAIYPPSFAHFSFAFSSSSSRCRPPDLKPSFYLFPPSKITQNSRLSIDLIVSKRLLFSCDPSTQTLDFSVNSSAPLLSPAFCSTPCCR